jgi:tungstate transport system substrate-binding protein
MSRLNHGRAVLMLRHRFFILALILAAGFAQSGLAGDRTITVASTTSTEQSGLFGRLLPAFTQKTGIEVKVVAVGTGQALDIARRGDADVVLVHDRPAEDKFMAEGQGVARFDVMYNDFIILGPTADPAKAAGHDVVKALQRIAESKVPFISRGDRSGTHAAELRYWKEAGIDPARIGASYKDIGQGMGPALNMAAGTGAYVLSDRGTWLSFKNKANLVILVEGDSRLFNQYGVMLVNPGKHPDVKTADGQSFVDWLISPEGQSAVANYKIDGKQLFFPNATGVPTN